MYNTPCILKVAGSHLRLPMSCELHLDWCATLEQFSPSGVRQSSQIKLLVDMTNINMNLGQSNPQ